MATVESRRREGLQLKANTATVGHVRLGVLESGEQDGQLCGRGGAEPGVELEIPLPFRPSVVDRNVGSPAEGEQSREGGSQQLRPNPAQSSGRARS